MKKLVIILTILFAVKCTAGTWYKVQGEYRFPSISEEQLEELIWAKISAMENKGAYPRDQYAYQYYMKDEDTVYILGVCNLNVFSELADLRIDLTKEPIAVSDGGTCVVNARYFLQTKTLTAFFNGSG